MMMLLLRVGIDAGNGRIVVLLAVAVPEINRPDALSGGLGSRHDKAGIDPELVR
jgi:hypothetical protein